MLDWFAPKCPLETAEKTWIERRMHWLADQFGLRRLLQAQVIVPEPAFFGDEKFDEEAGVRRLLDRLGALMGIPTAAIRLAIRDDEQMPGAAGHYQRRKRSVIRIARSQLADPVSLVATLAHELAHEALLGGGLLSADVPDHEPVTDLLPVFLGLGVFLANATVREASGFEGGWSWWLVSRQGYLSARLIGYALGLFAFVRDETRPPWAPYLRRDARAVLDAALHYLRKTGDSLFRPETVSRKYQPPTAAQAVEQMQAASSTVRLNALWEVLEHRLADGAVLEAVQARLDDRDPDVRAEALRAIGVFGAAATPVLPRLTDALHRGPLPVRLGAAAALGTLGLEPARVVPELQYLLRDGRRALIAAAADALASFKEQARPAVPELLAALETALVNCDDSLNERLVRTLQAISPTAQQDVEAHFADRDADFLREVQSLFRRDEAHGNCRSRD